MKTVGVFDSGVGGLSVLRSLLTDLPGACFVYVADSAHAPYGARSADQIRSRVLAIADALVHRLPLDALVVACNTATATAIEALRSSHPGLPVVGVEPALRPAAAASRTRHVGVLATPGTLSSRRYADLVARTLEAFPDVHISSQACEGLAWAIEQGEQERIRQLCQAAWSGLQAQATGHPPIDQLVLGCTHYPFASHELHALCGAGVHLVDPAAAVARQTRKVLGLAVTEPASPQAAPAVQWLATGDREPLERAVRRWLLPQVGGGVEVAALPI